MKEVVLVPVLTTDRLLLRPFEKTDFFAVHSYAASPANLQFMGWGPNSELETRGFLASTIRKGEEEPQKDFDFAVILPEENLLIGGCGLYLDRELHQASMGWILHRDYWGRGYGTEMAAELLRFGFSDLKLHRIPASCNSENHASYRVMEKNGMRREAHFVKARLGRVGQEIKWHDEYQYAILAQEWQEMQD